MAYRVFLSHSTANRGLVITLSNLLTKLGVDVFVAEWHLTPGEYLDSQVFAQIQRADCVVVLLTKNGIRSNWVQQEIGAAIKASRPVIPIVEKGTSSVDLAALQNRKYIEYDPLKPEQAILEASTYVKSLKLKKEEQEKTLLVAGGILALLLLLSGEKK